MKRKNNYWAKRLGNSFDELHSLSEGQINAELLKLYIKSYKKNILKIEALYNKMLKDAGESEFPTNIYNLERYYELQLEMLEDLRKLGYKEVDIMERRFTSHYTKIQKLIDKMIDLPAKFTTLSQYKSAKEIILSTWCADGKNFSDRVWSDKANLIDSITQCMQDALLRGISSDELTKNVRERFGVSFHNANRIVRTELTHVLGQAAADRYQQMGFTQYQVLACSDARTCTICKEQNGKIYNFSDMQPGVNMVPFHPNDRCTIIPVLDSQEMIAPSRLNN